MASNTQHHELPLPQFDAPVRLLAVVSPYYKDVTDGMLAGPNVEAMAEMVGTLPQGRRPRRVLYLASGSHLAPLVLCEALPGGEPVEVLQGGRLDLVVEAAEELEEVAELLAENPQPMQISERGVLIERDAMASHAPIRLPDLQRRQLAHRTGRVREGTRVGGRRLEDLLPLVEQALEAA